MPSSPMSLNTSIIETRWHQNIDSIIVLHACMADIIWCICKMLRMLRINMRMRMIVILIKFLPKTTLAAPDVLALYSVDICMHVNSIHFLLGYTCTCRNHDFTTVCRLGVTLINLLHAQKS